MHEVLLKRLHQGLLIEELLLLLLVTTLILNLMIAVNVAGSPCTTHYEIVVHFF